MLEAPDPRRSVHRAPGAPQSLSVAYFAGLIDTPSLAGFRRLVYRMSRGRAFVQSQSLGTVFSPAEVFTEDIDMNREDDFFRDVGAPQQTGDKSMVLLLFYGEAAQIGRKLEAAVRTFDVFSVSLPEDSSAIREKILEISGLIEAKKAVIKQSLAEVQKGFSFYFEAQQGFPVTRVEEMHYLIAKEKKIQSVVDAIEVTSQQLVRFRFWVPETKVQQLLDRVAAFYRENSKLAEPVFALVQDKSKVAPTYFEHSDFMAPFQTIVETFSVPRYKEMNPAVFTIATFPCFFGMMFGDVCHGTIILTFGLYLLAHEQRIRTSKQSVLKMALPLRYLVTLMGLFSVYSGFVYSEFGSMFIPIFSSCYELTPDESAFERKDPDCVYPFGVDWAWATSTTEVSYYNSFKMKLSIIIGVLQMLLGIVLKGFNSVYFDNFIDFWCEFVPQFLFLACSFGYMALLIIIKWLTNWDDHRETLGNKGPPQIVAVFTSLTHVTPELTVLGDTDLQQTVQYAILGTRR